jgi:hypothetical protein
MGPHAIHAIAKEILARRGEKIRVADLRNPEYMGWDEIAKSLIGDVHGYHNPVIHGLQRIQDPGVMMYCDHILFPGRSKSSHWAIQTETREQREGILSERTEAISTIEPP